MKYVYKSVFKKEMEDYMLMRLNSGFDEGSFSYLKIFDAFLCEKGYSDHFITKDIIDQWAIQKNTEIKNTRNSRVNVIKQFCQYLNDLYVSAGWYKDSLLLVQKQYEQHLQTMKSIILEEGRTDWNAYTSTDKITIENTVLLVGLLYKMCKVQVVLQSQEREGMNQVNHKELNQNVADAKSILQKIA